MEYDKVCLYKDRGQFACTNGPSVLIKELANLNARKS